MARNSSLRYVRFGIAFVLLAFYGYQRLQQSTNPTPQPKATPTRSPRTTSNPSVGPSQPLPPDSVDSNEGNLLLGNASNAGMGADNFLVKRPQYSISYNRSIGGPNWVAWHVDGGDLGEVERGKFRPDPDLPRDWQITPNDYKNSGYDRGHVCPSGDRTDNREDNNATFYMSNMLPQTAELNQHVWADLENWSRAQVRNGSEIYQIAGGAGKGDTVAGGKVVVPTICWKVILLLPDGQKDKSRIGTKTRVVAVSIPNVTDKKLETADWRDYIVSAAKIERAARVNLFADLSPNLQKSLESQVDSGD